MSKTKVLSINMFLLKQVLFKRYGIHFSSELRNSSLLSNGLSKMMVRGISYFIAICVYTYVYVHIYTALDINSIH